VRPKPVRSGGTPGRVEYDVPDVEDGLADSDDGFPGLDAETGGTWRPCQRADSQRERRKGREAPTCLHDGRVEVSLGDLVGEGETLQREVQPVGRDQVKNRQVKPLLAAPREGVQLRGAFEGQHPVVGAAARCPARTVPVIGKPIEPREPVPILGDRIDVRGRGAHRFHRHEA
jgi:hypothetical protein